MSDKRIVAARMGDGRIGLVEQDVPELRPGTVRVQVHASLVSPGTELGGWRALAAERDKPRPDAEPRPFGYANAGVVQAVGEGVERFKPGHRVACMGGGYALHTNHAVVPHHLCVALPDNVTFAQGAYGHLAATALNGLRRGGAELGEHAAVLGLGVVGQLTAMLYQRAGNFVIGWDTIRRRVEIARRWGIDAAVVVGADDEVAATKAFTRGEGLDTAVLAFGGDANAAMQAVYQCLKCTPDGHPVGRVVVLGGVRFEYGRGPITNADIRRAGRTGPGYHDEAWEHGPDYPPVFMRWTTRTNLELIMRLIGEGRLNVDCLTTHTIPLADVEAAVAAILDAPDEILGVVFTMEH